MLILSSVSMGREATTIGSLCVHFSRSAEVVCDYPITRMTGDCRDKSTSEQAAGQTRVQRALKTIIRHLLCCLLASCGLTLRGSADRLASGFGQGRVG